ncbi:TPA: hypothetical protein ACJEU7_003032 [Acinetobacter baumannii]|uniref:hypothetical protein n=1 Tax=Acinetobacter baumannii TaxID=470 RepID=UPI002255216B|nr:hypothetical protein [Acinetobacter baumannii]MCX3034101.1 hypothetical protein [Acinetobacter baumannii]
MYHTSCFSSDDDATHMSEPCSFSRLAINNMTANLVNAHFAKDKAVSVSVNDSGIYLHFEGEFVASYSPYLCTEQADAHSQAKALFSDIKKVIAELRDK